MRTAADYMIASITRRADQSVRKEIEDRVKGLDCILCERPHTDKDATPAFLKAEDVLKAIRGEW